MSTAPRVEPKYSEYCVAAGEEAVHWKSTELLDSLMPFAGLVIAAGVGLGIAKGKTLRANTVATRTKKRQLESRITLPPQIHLHVAWRLVHGEDWHFGDVTGRLHC